ncbi:hypothetical protein [Nitrospirillum iridis]|uniref:DUF3828 domain-containing protein n=1 Tax=Nitrospirillum iridis TaxID=765888 RepID=A0A7X0B0B4_9PROT|nr:hypothetical protein [Nitrospirillum iridis]MBB6253432.1 hypothetical protein [Nitrospirillum iridis]
MASSPRPPLSYIEEIYQPYLADPHAEKPRSLDALDLIRPRASPALAGLLDAERACRAHGREICTLDFDVIIAGQDWQLSDFHLLAQPAGRTATVTARFVNAGTPCVVVYPFVLSDGRWVIDDVVIQRNEVVAPDHPWSLKATLEGAYGGAPKRP